MHQPQPALDDKLKTSHTAPANPDSQEDLRQAPLLAAAPGSMTDLQTDEFNDSEDDIFNMGAYSTAAYSGAAALSDAVSIYQIQSVEGPSSDGNNNIFVLYLTLTTDAQCPPWLIYKLELQPKANSIRTIHGISSISVMSVFSLIRDVPLPEEVKRALRNIATTVATARNIPHMEYPIDYLCDFYIFASVSDIMTSAAPSYQLQSVLENSPENSSQPQKLKFVVILIQPELAYLLGGITEVSCFSSLPAPTSISFLIADSSPSSSNVQSVQRNVYVPPITQTESLSLGLSRVSSPYLNAMRETPSVSSDSDGIDPQLTVALQPEANQAAPSESLSLSGPSSITDSHPSAPISARDVDHACYILEIEKPHGTQTHHARNRSLSVLTQDWNRVRTLLLGLGFREDTGKENGLSEQTYEWENGLVESFKTILKSVHWTKGDYEMKTSLYGWARDSAANKIWNPNLTEPTDAIHRQTYNNARDVWNQIVLFFNHTRFQYTGHPHEWPQGTVENSLSLLTQSAVKHNRTYIKRCLIDRP
ncbi:hypothetical protein C8R42DRAFT_715171 [Lentinula raphanica]|nr:hypothetical protein C8R42DRAFT_715171 [Lentinula raphanica]